MKNFILSIIKQLGVPCLMVTSCTAVEELIIRSIKLIDTLARILRCVGMYHVKQHTDAHIMCLIYQIFQILWHTTSGCRCEEATDLITKGTVVRMLHNGHNLDGVVSKILDAWKYVICKLEVGANLSLLLSHAYMALINIRRQLAVEILIGPRKWSLRIIHLCTPLVGLRILYDSSCIQRDTLKLLSLVLDDR